MSFTYAITQDNYLFTIEYILRKKAQKPSRRLWLFLLTWGQTTAVAVCLVFLPLTRSQRLALAALSLLTTLLYTGYSRAYRFKAHFLLSGLLSAGQYSPEFWGQHNLRQQGGLLVLRYGREEYQLPCDGVASVVEDDRFLYILEQSGRIWEAIPRQANTPESAEDLMGWIRKG